MPTALDNGQRSTRKQLADRLAKILTEAGDPRLGEKDRRFEKPPLTDAASRKKK